MTGQQHHRQWSDQYMMYEYKVKQCLRTDHHNWKHCPWRHPGETAAQRRHPSVHKPTFCMNLKMSGECAAGDSCPFSHNTFEMSLHPLRYKTTLCNLGEKCNREICFFAHSHKELRQPEPEQAVISPAPTAAGIQVSGDSFTGASPAGAVHVLANTAAGDLVQLSGGSFTSAAGAQMSAGSFTSGRTGAAVGGMYVQQQQLLQQQADVMGQQAAQQQQQQQQQLLLLQQQLNSQQQLQQQQQVNVDVMSPATAAAAAGSSVQAFEVEASAPAGGFFSRVLSFNSGSAQQQQGALQRQDLCNFSSFTSQGSAGSFSGRTAAALQQQLLLQQAQQQQAAMQLRQELNQFDSFTSQGSFSAATSNRNMALALQQQQQQQAVAQLRQDLAQFDSFTSQGSFSVGAGVPSALQRQQPTAVQLQQDLGNFDSFTSQGSRSVASLQQQALLLRQELAGFDSITSQSSYSTGGGSFSRATAPGAALLQQQQLGAQPPILDTTYDSFTSQCSTSSQVTGSGFRRTPLSPLLDKSQLQGLAQGSAQGLGYGASDASSGLGSADTRSGLVQIISAPPPMCGGNAIGSSVPGLSAEADVTGAGAFGASGLVSGGQTGLTGLPDVGASGGASGVTVVSSGLQQEVDITAEMQKQVMRLQLHSSSEPWQL